MVNKVLKSHTGAISSSGQVRLRRPVNRSESLMKIKFSGPALPRSGTLVLLLAEGKSLTGLADKADRACKGQIARAWLRRPLPAVVIRRLDILAPGGGLGRVVVFGLGDPAKLTSLTWRCWEARWPGPCRPEGQGGIGRRGYQPQRTVRGRLRRADRLRRPAAGLQFQPATSRRSPRQAGLAELTIHTSDAAARRPALPAARSGCRRRAPCPRPGQRAAQHPPSGGIRRTG